MAVASAVAQTRVRDEVDSDSVAPWPAENVGTAGSLPIVLTRVGRERPEIAARVTTVLER